NKMSIDLYKVEIRNLAKKGTAIILSSHQMKLIEEMCDRLFMMQRGEKIVYGTLDEIKTVYANFKCTVRGPNRRTHLEQIADVESIEQTGDTLTLYLSKDVHPATWLKRLPDHLIIHELTIDRISLHEIFIDVATNKNLLQEVGETYA